MTWDVYEGVSLGSGLHAPYGVGTGSEGSHRAQSADRCEVEPERDHPGRSATSEGRCGGCVLQASGTLCVRARWCTPTTRASEWAESMPF